jgi:hypothetical protein
VLYHAFVGLFKDYSVGLFLLSLKKNNLYSLIHEENLQLIICCPVYPAGGKCTVLLFAVCK